MPRHHDNRAFETPTTGLDLQQSYSVARSREALYSSPMLLREFCCVVPGDGSHPCWRFFAMEPMELVHNPYVQCRGKRRGFRVQGGSGGGRVLESTEACHGDSRKLLSLPVLFSLLFSMQMLLLVASPLEEVNLSLTALASLYGSC